MTSLDGITDRSIQTLLRGENDSKELDEIQARLDSISRGFHFRNSSVLNFILFVKKSDLF